MKWQIVSLVEVSIEALSRKHESEKCNGESELRVLELIGITEPVAEQSGQWRRLLSRDTREDPSSPTAWFAASVSEVLGGRDRGLMPDISATLYDAEHE